MSRPICLFDMDGTLTPPRKPIDKNMSIALHELSKSADIGIVSGSPWGYIEQQLSALWKNSPGHPQINLANLIIMPCNGTQLMQWNKKQKLYMTVYKTDFKEYIATHDKNILYKDYVRHILELQLEFMNRYDFKEITGTFLSYRGSMINWSPVGRDAHDFERSEFIKLDKQADVRNTLSESLRVRLDASGLHSTDLNLGGSTSIDIHPTGWDKTHALRHCHENADVWFVGDKCNPGGNDASLHNALRQTGRSYATESPEQTQQIIKEKIIPTIEEQKR